MSIIKDLEKTQELALRVYNNKQDKELKLEDEKAIKALCSAIFPADGESASQHDLNRFNNIIVKTATAISEPDVQQLLKYFAEVQNVGFDMDMVRYTKAIPKHIKFKWASVGSAVSLKRVETGKEQYIQIGQVQTAITYHRLTNSETQVENFRALVRDVASARVQLIYDTIMNLIENSIKLSVNIPTKQVKSGANVSIAEFDKIANIIGRRTNSRPIFVADRELITTIASKKVTSVASAMPDALKMDFFNAELTNLGSADAIPFKNDFTSETGFETQFEVNTGYMLGSANGHKPFYVALAGGTTQNTEEDIEYGRIKMIIRQKIGIDFLYAGNIGVITDTSVTI